MKNNELLRLDAFLKRYKDNVELDDYERLAVAFVRDSVRSELAFRYSTNEKILDWVQTKSEVNHAGSN